MKFLKYLLVSLLMLLPTFAQADTIVKPPGKTMWEMHVMGNGPIIASVLESVKLVIAPDAGGGGFRSLLVFMAILGFCILAIQAGFNPGQNLFKMFGYLFVVWVVSLTATQLKADMLVIDPISNTTTPVLRVPAVVAIPASVVSGVGHFLTKSMQQAYSTAGQDIALTESGFDIFGKIQSDLDNFTISQPELQRSLSAFVADCTIPAIAQQRLTAAELMTSIDLLATLEKAKGGVFLTRYWPEATSKTTASSLMLESGIVTCTEAYNAIKVDIEKHAQQLKSASSREFARSGVMVPWEQQLQTYMEAANIGKTSGGATYGRPNGIITQKALINTMSGDFRNAAIQTGNNELLMGVQISQAEQSQRSGWVTSAAIFKNMMGYVYTTLQAFIFAIVPIVVVALMIPGLGKKIFVNYGQILVWLTLWEPMLSIVNYLVTLFRLEGVRNATHDAGGFNSMNSWVLSEGANNMVIAASFLGTMVPILTWGLVTGAMAFNEFISQGVGSSFAMTAGANAATGTSAMNNMNMNNASNNGYSTAQKATVGNQQVMAHENAGALMIASEGGGMGMSKDGGNFSSSGTQSTAKADTTSTSAQATNTITGSAVASAGKSLGKSEQESSDAKLEQSRGVSDDKTTQQTAATSHGASNSNSTTQSAKTDHTGTAKDSSSLTAQLGSGVKSGSGGGGGDAGGAAGAAGARAKAKSALSNVKSSAGVQAAQTSAEEIAISNGKGTAASTSQKADSSVNTGNSAANAQSTKRSEQASNSRSHGRSSKNDESAGSNESVTKANALAKVDGTSKALTDTTGITTSVPLGLNREEVIRAEDAAYGYKNDPAAEVARVEAAAAMTQVGADIAAQAGRIDAARDNLQGAGSGPTSFGLTGFAGPGANTAGLMNAANAAVAAGTASVQAGVAAQGGASTSAIRTTAEGATEIGTTRGVEAGTGASPLQQSEGFNFKQAGLAGGLLTSAAGSALDFVSSSRALAAAGGAGAGAGGAGAAGAGGLTAGGLAVGTAYVAGAGVAGWYAGRGLVHVVGEENVANALEPAFKYLDSITDNRLHNLF